MTLVQWLFHYMEIMKYTSKNRSEFLRKMNDLELSIQATYLMINQKAGKELIAKIDEIKRDSNNPKKDDSKPEYVLTDEDKELLAFMETVPKTIKETKEMRNAGRYMLPKASIKKLKQQDKRPECGFKKGGEN